MIQLSSSAPNQNKAANHLFKARDMSEEVLHEKVQRLVNNFREQLRGVLEVNCSLLPFSQARSSYM